MGLNDLIISSRATPLALSKIHFSAQNKALLNQLLNEFKHIEAIKKFNLSVDHKILLHGHSGCGKTATAKAIADQLNKKIIILNLGSFVSSRLGETAKNISAIFNKAAREEAVFFIDEFDYIGKIRDYDEKDSGEMKRIVNTIIQLIDHLPSNTLLIGATNHIESIDTALIRRFQLRLKFELPDQAALDLYYDDLLSEFPKPFQGIERVYGISYAEAKDLVHQSVKRAIITEEEAKLK